MKPIFIDEIIEKDVEQVSYALIDSLRWVDNNITGVWFQQGHPLEVIQQLSVLAGGISTKKERYPLVALFRDFPEDIAPQAGIYSEATVNIIIATRTEPTYNSDQRKEKSFKPILYPIYYALMDRLGKNPAFMKPVQGALKHTRIDHYFWGKESVYGSEANIFKDWIDCIEIKGLKLKTYQKNC